MENVRIRKVLQDRLLILEALEALSVQAPQQEYYDEKLRDFGVSTTIDGMTAQLKELERNGIATFAFPEVNTFDFWEAPVRIRRIDLGKLQAMHASILEEMGRNVPIAGDASGRDAESENSQPASEQSHDPARERTPGTFDAFNAIAVVIGLLLSIVALISSQGFLKAWVVKTLAIASIMALIVMSSRLYSSWRREKLSRRHIIDLAIIGVVCISGTIVISGMFGSRSSAQVALQSLQFDSVSTQPFECKYYLGTGTIPDGYKLLIFDSPARNGPYYLDGKAGNIGKGVWQTPLVMAGHDPTWISGVLIESSFAKFALSIKPVPPKASWISTQLPPSKESISPVTVWPVLNGGGCPPSSRKNT